MTILFLLVAAGLLGCEENIASRVDYAPPFTLYGVISPDLDTQSVRVYPAEDFITFGPSEPSDIAFNSTDLNTGTHLTWRDSVIAEPNGLYEYVFWAPFRAEFGHRYRIEAKRLSDGERSWADVRVPPLVTVRLVDNDARAMQVLIEGEGTRVLKPELGYDVNHVDGDIFSRIIVPVNYEGHEKSTEQGWEVTFDMFMNRYYIHGILEVGLKCPTLKLYGIEFRVLIGDAVWSPPTGFFESGILSQPQTMSNVENGLGFIGGGYRIVERLYPGREAVEQACFVYVP